jgi:DNA-binding SARP family transcriptional activator
VDPPLHVCLLGIFQLQYKGETVNTINSTRLQSLIAFILLHRQKPISRQQLAAVFWPDTSEAQSRTNLRNLIYKLCKALPEADSYLKLSNQEVQWVDSTSLVLDVQEFENAVQTTKGQADEQEKLTRAVQLYQGDLLPECYDEWLNPERERLRRQLSNALDRLINVLERKRDYLAAIVFAERLLQLDQLNESAHRHIMRLHSLAGDRTGALRAYQSCAAELKKELSIEPEAETLALYNRLLNSETYKPLSPAENEMPRIKPFVGREREWTQVQQAWTRATESHPHCVVISGEAGIGKTRLAEEMMLWVTRQGYLSAVARCFASEGGLAYAPIAEWLRTNALRKQWINLEPTWLIELARVMPEINAERPDLPRSEGLSADWQRRHLFEALVRAFSTSVVRAHSALIAILLDDLQWCDSDTLAWLHYLMRSSFPAKLLLVATLRSEELTSGSALELWMKDLRSIDRLDEVELGPLNAAETKVLAENEAGRALELDVVTRLFAETEGHPLFVVESVRMAGDTDPSVVQRFPEWEEIRQSPTIQAVIARRLALLSPAGRDLVGLAATIGHSFAYPVLANANTEIDEVTLVHALDELLQRRIIHEQGASTYNFSHDKIRAAAYQGMSTARRRYLHRCIGECLEDMVKSHQSGGSGDEMEEFSGQIGSQYANAGLAERAVPFYLNAAEVAQKVFANERALHFFQLAFLQLHDPASRITNPVLAAQIEEQVGNIQLLMTHRTEARATFERGLQLLPASERKDRAALLGKIGNTWRDQYHFEDSLAIYNQALETLGEPTGLEGDFEQKWWQCRIQIQIEIQNVYYWLAWIEKAEALYQEMRPAVERYASFLQRATFFQLLAMIRLRANRYVATGEIVDISKTSLEASLKARISERIPADRFGYGFALLLHGDLDRAEEEIGTVLPLAEQRGDHSLETRCLTYLTIVHRKRGDVGQALNLARRALAAAETAKMPEYAGAAKANLAWAALYGGDTVEAREQALAALDLWDQSPGIQAAATPYYWTAIWPLVRVCLAEDNLPGSFSFARKLLEPQRKGLPPDLTAALTRAIDTWEAGPPQAARDALSSAAELAEMLGEF